MNNAKNDMPVRSGKTQVFLLSSVLSCDKKCKDLK